jgi:hypothetical protein
MDQAERYVYPQFGRLSDEAFGYGSIANQDAQATRAAADSVAATTGAVRNFEQNLASMGINPADERYSRGVASIELQGAANQAAAATGARERTQNLGFARAQDITALGMGTPTQATAALNAAANTGTNIANMATQQTAANNAAIANMTRAGVDIYGLLKAADGGYITMKDGGYVRPRKYARGGFVAPVTPPPAPMSAPEQNMGPANLRNGIVLGGGAGKVGGMLAAGPANLGAAAEFGTTPFSEQTRMLISQQGGPQSYIKDSIGQAMDSVFGSSGAGATTNLAAEGATAATAAEGATAAAGAAEGAAAAATAAEGAGAMSALGTAGGAISAAMPWVGAGLAAYGLGQTLGWWADGGKVTPGSNGAKGGEVDGPGGPKDDLIPAMLSDGEFVLPVGTVKKYGLAKLEKMRQEGLAFEKELGIRKK